MIDFGGKVVLVTGGSRGIGAATVETLARANANVVLHYGRSRAEAETLAGRIGLDRCLPVQADLAEEASAPRLWREANDHIDVVPKCTPNPRVLGTFKSASRKMSPSRICAAKDNINVVTLRSYTCGVRRTCRSSAISGVHYAAFAYFMEN